MHGPDAAESVAQTGDQSGWSLPAWTYSDQDFLALERDRIFLPAWHLVCHVSDIPQRGDYRSFALMGELAIVLRGRDGTIRAFHNICRHRAARLLDGEAGNCGARILCPYHAWSFDLDGQLIGVPFIEEYDNFRKEDHGLVPIEHEVFAGFVYIRFAGAGGPDLAETLAPVAEEMGIYRFAEMEPIGPIRTRIREVNWKNASDNYVDGLHIRVAHPGLDSLVGESYRLTVDRGVDKIYASIDRTGHIGASVDAYRRLLPPVDHLPEDRQRLWTYYRLWPSLMFDVYPDQIDFMQFIPLSPTRCIIRDAAYALPDARREMRLARWLNQRINRDVNAEDKGLIERVQAGMASSSFTAGPLGRNEVCLRNFAERMRATIPLARERGAPVARTAARSTQGVTAAAGTTPAQAGKRPAKLGRWMTTSLVVGNMIGSGVFLLPTSLAPLGWNSVAGWILTLTGGMFLAATFVRLVRALPRAGGPYAYTNAAFGPLAAFLVAWSYWASNVIGLAAIAVAAVSYLSALAPGLAALPGMQIGATCLLIWLLTLLNTRGTCDAGAFQLVTTGLKLLPLIAVIVIAAIALGTGRAAVPPVHASTFNGGAITAAATLTLWALLGLEAATVPADKIEDPQRTIAFATIVGTAATGIIYLITCSLVVLLMPADALAQSGAPFADFVDRFWGPGPASLIALFAAISCIGALNGWILVQAELTRAMALDGSFPRALATETLRGTPARALFVSAALMTAVVLLNYTRGLVEIFQFLLLLATATSLFMYLVCALAMLKMDGEQRFPLPGRRAGMSLAALAALYSLWTIYGAGAPAVGWGLALVAAGVPIYFASRRSAQPPG